MKRTSHLVAQKNISSQLDSPPSMKNVHYTRHCLSLRTLNTAAVISTRLPIAAASPWYPFVIGMFNLRSSVAWDALGQCPIERPSQSKQSPPLLPISQVHDTNLYRVSIC